ncbi:hypothetical protein [Streptomyces sp. NPDC050428]|uniref:hypothetical protein n=1 Tax=Streptomyces sp. NPDC050428 TaxID=3155757 RepID=UPI00342EE392
MCTDPLGQLNSQPHPTAPESAPAAAAPLFAAIAAYEAAADSALSRSPQDLLRLDSHLLALRSAVPAGLHLALAHAHAGVRVAREALGDARGLKARNAAYSQGRAAIQEACDVILAVAPHAYRMHGTDMPGTPETIRAAARAYNAVGSAPEELSGIETGVPTVHVDCRSDSRTGWNVTARITAGVNMPLGYLPAHPPIVITFRRRDGRKNAADNARREIGGRFNVAVPIEYINSRQI